MRIDWDKARQADSEFGIFSSLLEDRLRYWDEHSQTPVPLALDDAKALWGELEPIYRRKEEEMQRRREAYLAEVELIDKRLQANMELQKSRHRAYVVSNVVLAFMTVALVAFVVLNSLKLLPWE